MEKRITGSNIQKIFIIGIIFFLFAVIVQGKESFLHEKKPFIRLAQSLILPGWGQFSNKKYLKSSIFFSTAVISVFATINSYNLLEDSFNDYNREIKLGNITYADELYDRYKNKFTLHQYLITTVIIFWGLNSLDAFFDAHFLKINIKKDNENLKLYIEKEF